MRRLLASIAVLVSLFSAAAYAMPTYIVDLGSVGDSLDGVRIPVAADVSLADALSATVVFSEGKFVITPNRYQIGIGLRAPAIQDRLGRSNFHPLEQLGENGEAFRTALSNGNGLGDPSHFSYNWGSSFPPNATTILGGVDLYGFSWSIAPTVIGPLPELVALELTFFDLTGGTNEVTVGAAPSEVPAPGSFSLLVLSLVGSIGLRRFRQP